MSDLINFYFYYIYIIIFFIYIIITNILKFIYIKLIISKSKILYKKNFFQNKS